MLDKGKKEKIIKKFRSHDTDTGSPSVQIALLSAQIQKLSDHLKTHRNDVSSRRGLIKMVSERRSLLKYLEREDPKAHAKVAEELGIKIKE